MKTTHLKPSAPLWHIVDATDMTIGRLATKVATVLRGKHRPSYSPHVLCGDHVIIINAAKLNVSPTKARRKTYADHTGRPGGFSVTSLGKMMERNPKKVMEMAIRGMIPANRLRNEMMRRLHVFADDQHKYAPQKPQPLNLATI